MDTVSIAGDLVKKLAAIAAAGFDGVEVFENDFLAFDASPREIGRMVVHHGQLITLFQPFRDFKTLPEPQRARAFERAKRKFDVVEELGDRLSLRRRVLQRNRREAGRLLFTETARKLLDRYRATAAAGRSVTDRAKLTFARPNRRLPG